MRYLTNTLTRNLYNVLKPKIKLMPDKNLFFEDFKIGQKFISGKVKVQEVDIKKFASSFDPQPFHTNEELAQRSFFNSLVASGWHTAGIAMRLLVESNLKPAGGLIGAGIDQLRWPIPVYPNDELSLDIEVVDIKPSKSKPDRGLIKIKVLTKNQSGQIVMSYVATLVVSRLNTYSLY